MSTQEQAAAELDDAALVVARCAAELAAELEAELEAEGAITRHAPEAVELFEALKTWTVKSNAYLAAIDCEGG